MRIFRHAYVAILLVLGLAAAEPGVAAASPTDAATFIQEFGNRAIAALTSDDISDDELERRFRTLFQEGFDVPALGRRALGRYWRRASEQEREEYMRLFESYVVRIYASRFRQYTGEKFVVRESLAGPSEYVIVLSEVIPPNGGPPVRVEWTVEPANGNYKIEDVKIEGVSMVITQRDEFAAVIQNRGGKVSGLIEALREKTADLKSTANSGN